MTLSNINNWLLLFTMEPIKTFPAEANHADANRDYPVKGGIGGSIFWVVCILLAVALIHFSCQAGTATGYVGSMCREGMKPVDILGLICCAPLYLLIIVILSGGLQLWS